MLVLMGSIYSSPLECARCLHIFIPSFFFLVACRTVSDFPFIWMMSFPGKSMDGENFKDPPFSLESYP